MFKINKKYYWYQVRFKYTNHNKYIFDWVTQIGLVKQKSLLNPREIKKIDSTPLHLMPGIPKELLCNGLLELEIISYLGKFRK